MFKPSHDGKDEESAQPGNMKRCNFFLFKFTWFTSSVSRLKLPYLVDRVL